MAACAFFTSDTFEMGDLLCVNPTTGYAIQYDPLDPLPVLGIAFVVEPGYSPNGRNWFCINSNPYYENDFFVWKEDLTSDFTTENTSYAPFNPLGDSGYITAITNGIAPVKKSITSGIPSSWIKLRTGTSLDWYLVK